jgi:hypothetical protein
VEHLHAIEADHFQQVSVEVRRPQLDRLEVPLDRVRELPPLLVRAPRLGLHDEGPAVVEQREHAPEEPPQPVVAVVEVDPLGDAHTKDDVVSAGRRALAPEVRLVAKVLVLEAHVVREPLEVKHGQVQRPGRVGGVRS